MVETRVAACGLFCGNCGKLQRGRCEGCVVQPGLRRCRIRACAFERGFATCAECEEMETCKILNNFISKIFGFIFRSDRMGGLRMIRDEGMEKFIAFKTAQGKM
jgi:hypothetical protein